MVMDSVIWAYVKPFQQANWTALKKIVESGGLISYKDLNEYATVYDGRFNPKDSMRH